MVRMMRFSIIGIRFLTPWVVRASIVALNLALTAFVAFWVGVPTAVRRIANQWTDAAVNAGIPSEYDTVLFYATSVMAFVMVAVGWIIAAYITVILIQVILWW